MQSQRRTDLLLDLMDFLEFKEWQRMRDRRDGGNCGRQRTPRNPDGKKLKERVNHGIKMPHHWSASSC